MSSRPRGAVRRACSAHVLRPPRAARRPLQADCRRRRVSGSSASAFKHAEPSGVPRGWRSGCDRDRAGHSTPRRTARLVLIAANWRRPRNTRAKTLRRGVKREPAQQTAHEMGTALRTPRHAALRRCTPQSSSMGCHIAAKLRQRPETTAATGRQRRRSPSTYTARRGGRGDRWRDRAASLKGGRPAAEHGLERWLSS